MIAGLAFANGPSKIDLVLSESVPWIELGKRHRAMIMKGIAVSYFLFFFVSLHFDDDL